MTTFRTSRELPFPADAVFDAIRTPARLARWWGPSGFTNSFRVFEFRPGGRWSFTMHGPKGANHPNESEFVEIVPGALVRIRHVSPPQFVLSIVLAPRSYGTLVTWEQVFADAQLGESLRPVVEPANEQNLDRLAAELAAAAEGEQGSLSTELSFSRLVPEADGGSRFETIAVPVTLQQFAPPAQPFAVSALSEATQCGFLHLPAGWAGEMHPSPMRMWIFLLEGEMQFEAGNGEARRIAAGSALLLEDTTGRGHVSRVLGPRCVTIAVVRLPEAR